MPKKKTEPNDNEALVVGALTGEYQTIPEIAEKLGKKPQFVRNNLRWPSKNELAAKHPDKKGLWRAATQDDPPPPGRPKTAAEYAGFDDPHCSVCGLPQKLTRGGLVCDNGHGGADSVTLAEWDKSKAPPPDAKEDKSLERRRPGPPIRKKPLPLQGY